MKKLPGRIIFIFNIVLVLLFLFLLVYSWVLSLIILILSYFSKEEKEGKWGFYISIVLFIIVSSLTIIPFITGANYSLLVIQTCTMNHEVSGFEEAFKSEVYSEYGLTLDDTKSWPFQNGLSKGDIIILGSKEEVKVGDIILFSSGPGRNPIAHRLIKDTEPYSTKGDNYITNSRQLPIEESIDSSQVLGKVNYRIPKGGMIKASIIDIFSNNPSNDFGC